MNFSQKIAYNTLIQAVGKAITLVLGLATISLFTGFLGTENYGYYSIITTYLGVFAIFADMGLNLITVRELSAHKQPKQLLQEVLGFRIVTGLIVLGIAPLIAFFIPSYPMVVKIAIAVMSWAFFFNIVNLIGVGYFQARIKMSIPTITEIIGKAVTLGLVYLLSIKAQEHPTLYMVVAAVIIGNFVTLLATFGALKANKQPISPKWNQGTYRFFMQDSVVMTTIIILGTIHFKADALILSFFKPATEVGLYGLAYKVIEIILTVPAIFIGIIFPAMTAHLNNKHHDLANRIFDKSFRIMAIGSIAVATFLVIFAPQVISIIQGQSGFEASAHPLRVLALSLPPVFIGALIRIVIIALYRQKQLISQLAWVTVINVVLNLILIPHFSYMAAAWITVLTETLVTLLPLTLMKDIFPLKNIARITGHTLVMTCVFALLTLAVWKLLPIDIGELVVSSSKIVGFLWLGATGVGLLLMAVIASFITGYLHRADIAQLMGSKKDIV